jgi:hypothetical protein
VGQRARESTKNIEIYSKKVPSNQEQSKTVAPSIETISKTDWVQDTDLRVQARNKYTTLLVFAPVYGVTSTLSALCDRFLVKKVRSS